MRNFPVRLPFIIFFRAVLDILGLLYGVYSGCLSHILGRRPNHIGYVVLQALISAAIHAVICFEVPNELLDLHPLL
jgi:hypothetical protein